MIKVNSDPETDVNGGEVRYDFFADTKSEVTNSMSNAVGLMKGFKIAQGSTVMTANGEFAFRKSNGTWNWVGEE